MSRRVEITKEIIGDLIRNIRKTMDFLKYEEYKLLILLDWYQPDAAKILKAGEIIKDTINKDL